MYGGRRIECYDNRNLMLQHMYLEIKSFVHTLAK